MENDGARTLTHRIWPEKSTETVELAAHKLVLMMMAHSTAENAREALPHHDMRVRGKLPEGVLEVLDKAAAAAYSI